MAARRSPDAFSMTIGTGSQPVPSPTLPDSSSALRNSCETNGLREPPRAFQASLSKLPTPGARRTVSSVEGVSLLLTLEPCPQPLRRPKTPPWSCALSWFEQSRSAEPGPAHGKPSRGHASSPGGRSPMKHDRPVLSFQVCAAYAQNRQDCYQCPQGRRNIGVASQSILRNEPVIAAAAGIAIHPENCLYGRVRGSDPVF